MKRVAVASVVLLFGCAKSAVEERPKVCGVPVATDIDPDPDRVEVHLRAAPATWDPGTGKAIQGYAYDGIVPGPLIVVEKGQTLKVHFHNMLDANAGGGGMEHATAAGAHAPGSTTIHWHGLRVPDTMDGATLMQDPIAPGEDFTYEFTVPDPGFYWYHPHLDTDQQIEKGLYAPLLVRDPSEPEVGCEIVVLDDVLLDSAGQVRPPSDMMEGMMGRLGNLLLANGRVDREIHIAPGERKLLHFVNAANARYFNLRIEGHPFTVVGTDGGYLSAPHPATRLVMTPGERYSVLIGGDLPPGKLTLDNYDWPLNTMMNDDPLGDGPNPVLTIRVAGDSVAMDEPVMPASLPAPLDGAVAHRWVIDESGMMELTIDGATWPNIPVLTYPRNVATVFEVENRSMHRHPMHIHGQRFQILSINGQAPPSVGWKDTFDVPSNAVVRFVSPLDNPGRWMYHCHILEHAEMGMMGELVVE